MMHAQLKPCNPQSSTANVNRMTGIFNAAQSLNTTKTFSPLALIKPSSTAQSNRSTRAGSFLSDIKSQFMGEKTSNPLTDFEPTKVVVIAGGTRGIGEGLATAFSNMDHKVFITGQSDQSVSTALNTIQAQNPQANIRGKACDIRRLDDIQAVWNEAVEQFGRVDYWITCAGIAQPFGEQGSLKRLVDMRGEGLCDVVDVNVTGSINCANIVVPQMEKQGHGHFYLFEGFGSDGTIRTGFAAYGASKVAIQYLTKALAQENAQANSPVNIGSLAPGIVVTDLLKNAYDKDSDTWKKDKAIYEILADPVEPVAQFLAEQVLKNKQNGKTINWLTPAKALSRFAMAPFGKRKEVDLDS